MSNTESYRDNLRANEAARWRWKTWEESERDQRRRRRRFNPVIPLLAALAAAGAACMIWIVIGSPRWNRPPMKPADAAVMFPFLTMVLFIVFYVVRITADRRRSQLLICPKCFEIYTRLESNLTCRACGTLLENADGWTYNRCPHCDYDLRCSSGRCPECGARL